MSLQSSQQLRHLSKKNRTVNLAVAQCLTKSEHPMGMNVRTKSTLNLKLVSEPNRLSVQHRETNTCTCINTKTILTETLHCDKMTLSMHVTSGGCPVRPRESSPGPGSSTKLCHGRRLFSRCIFVPSSNCPPPTKII